MKKKEKKLMMWISACVCTKQTYQTKVNNQTGWALSAAALHVSLCIFYAFNNTFMKSSAPYQNLLREVALIGHFAHMWSIFDSLNSTHKILLYPFSWSLSLLYHSTINLSSCVASTFRVWSDRPWTIISASLAVEWGRWLRMRSRW